MLPKAARWLDLIAFLLQHRFPVSREQIFERITAYRDDDADPETRRRRFERDKDELRGLGIEIETVQTGRPTPADEPVLGYRLREAHFYLPYLALAGTRSSERPYAGLPTVELSAEQLAVVDRALRRLARRTEFPLARAAALLRLKLAFDLPLPLQAVETVLSRDISRETSKSLEVLQRAVAARQAVQCVYHAIGRDALESRLIEPWGLFFNWGRWYCVGWSRKRNAKRVFRIDRMRDVRLLKGRLISFEVPSDFSVRGYLGRAPWELSERDAVPVLVRFAFPDSRWVQAEGLGKAVVPVREDGGAELQFGVRDQGPFLRWLLTFRGQAEVLEPASVNEALRDLRGRVNALYAGEAELA